MSSGVRFRGPVTIWPFTLAEYETLCPKGHHVELFNGYTVYAPSWWNQWGRCDTCHRDIERMVCLHGEKFFAGPIHWLGAPETAEQKNWFHDVLQEHNCPRCRQIGAQDLAQLLQRKIAKGAKIYQILEILKSY